MDSEDARAESFGYNVYQSLIRYGNVMGSQQGTVERLDELLTVGQAAEFLGVSKSTLRNWDRADKLKAFRHPINGYRLYHRGDLEELLCRIGESRTDANSE